MLEVGKLLKEEREKQGLSVKDVSLSTKIGSRIINAIENGIEEDLPQDSFLKGFLRSYASLLGLDPQMVMDRFYEEFNAHQPDKKNELSIEVAANKFSLFSLASKSLAVIAIVGLIIVAVTIKSVVEKYQKESIIANIPDGIATVDPETPPNNNSSHLLVLDRKESTRSETAVNESTSPLSPEEKKQAIAEANEKRKLEEQIKKAEAIQKAELERKTKEESLRLEAAARAEELKKAEEEKKRLELIAQEEARKKAEEEKSRLDLLAKMEAEREARRKIEEKTRLEELAKAEEKKKGEEKKRLAEFAKAEEQKRLAEKARVEVEAAETAKKRAIEKKKLDELAQTEAKRVASSEKVDSDPPPLVVAFNASHEVIVEALDAVQLNFKIDNKREQKKKLSPNQIYVIKGRTALSLSVDNGGAVNIIYNGKDLGAPGDLGKPTSVQYP